MHCLGQLLKPAAQQSETACSLLLSAFLNYGYLIIPFFEG
jgi:hypothetical protein